MFNLKLKHFTIIGVVLLVAFSLYASKRMIEQAHEISRVKENFNNALKVDSLHNAIFRIKSEQELDQLLESNQELSELVDRTNIKRKRIQTLYYQKQQYIDSLKKKMDVSGLVSNIRKDVPAIVQWQDTTECITVKGNVRYQNDSLSVNVTQKEANNNVVLLKHKGRRKPIKWLLGLRLGPRKDKFTAETKCGSAKVTIIEKD